MFVAWSPAVNLSQVPISWAVIGPNNSADLRLLSADSKEQLTGSGEGKRTSRRTGKADRLYSRIRSSLTGSSLILAITKHVHRLPVFNASPTIPTGIGRDVTRMCPREDLEWNSAMSTQFNRGFLDRWNLQFQFALLEREDSIHSFEEGSSPVSVSTIIGN